MEPKPPRGHFLPKMIRQNKFQLKIPILSKNYAGAIWFKLVAQFRWRGHVQNMSIGLKITLVSPGNAFEGL